MGDTLPCKKKHVGHVAASIAAMQTPRLERIPDALAFFREAK